MKNDNCVHRRRGYLNTVCWCVFLGLLLRGVRVHAQDAPPNDGASQGADATAQQPDASATDVGPVRMVRFKMVTGSVTWRADSGLDWSPASVNLPIRPGAQVYAPAGARAELQFDDGSMIHLGGGALVTFNNLYSDADGEFTQITLKDGIVSFRLRNKYSIYQVDTPLASVKAVGPARIRIGVRDIVEVGVRYGSATVEGPQDKATIQAKSFLTIQDTTTPYAVTNLPPDDTWEKWIQKRYQANSVVTADTQQNLPPDIYLVSPDLDTYGAWQTTPDYGPVWCPHVSADWRPYAAGSWVWVNPFGWTWVSTEAWGWAPYHYGGWVHGGFGWGWRPGPAHQCWSPGVVSFFMNGGSVAWAPLSPEEIRYPSAFTIGFHGGDWSLFFSIGKCGVYYPGEDHICEARPWNNAFVNRRYFLTDKNHDAAHFAFAPSHNAVMQAGGWVPHNARFGGGSIASLQEFGSGHHYAPVASNNVAVFQRARLIGAPENGRPSAGPPNVRPTLTSLTPVRTFTHIAPPAPVLSRPMYRAPVAQRIAQNAPVRTPRPGVIPSVGRPTAPVARPQPGSMADTVIRARSSIGLPQRARTEDGHVVGPGIVAPPVPTRPIGPPPRVFTPAPRVNLPAPSVVTPAPRVNPPAPRVVTPPPRVYIPRPTNYGVREMPRPTMPRPSFGGGGGGRGHH